MLIAPYILQNGGNKEFKNSFHRHM